MPSGKFASVDLTEIKELEKHIKKMGKEIAKAWKKVLPQFGAYMNYSLILEEGAVFTKIKRNPIKARPHIVPAIYEKPNAQAITGAVTREMLKIMQKVTKGASIRAKESIENMWIRVLNDKPRRFAVKETARQKIFQYGFHRRSIRGWANAPSISLVKGEQTAGNAERKQLDKDRRAKARR